MIVPQFRQGFRDFAFCDGVAGANQQGSSMGKARGGFGFGWRLLPDADNRPGKQQYS